MRRFFVAFKTVKLRPGETPTLVGTDTSVGRLCSITCSPRTLSSAHLTVTPPHAHTRQGRQRTSAAHWHPRLLTRQIRSRVVAPARAAVQIRGVGQQQWQQQWQAPPPHSVLPALWDGRGGAGGGSSSSSGTSMRGSGLQGLTLGEERWGAAGGAGPAIASTGQGQRDTAAAAWVSRRWRMM
jgi:hypothetical protein